jgi:SAM-dependent methyltransferase
MNAEDEIKPTARAAELLGHGLGTDPGPRQPLRSALRRVLLRAMRPYTHHQHLLDVELLAAVQRQGELLDHVRERDTERIERLEQIARELIRTAESLRRASSDATESILSELSELNSELSELSELNSELNALPYIEGSPFESFEAPVGEVIGFRSGARIRDGDSEYVAFEDVFRGSPARVLESQRPYSLLLRDHQPVLDIGCGRGELLTLLSEEGITASGVDSDAGMVERCRALGVQATLGDANEHLESLDDRSLGAVFSAQVIEHLPEEALRKTLELSRRKLRSGGLFIAETVNPHRVSSLKTFWVDLTHQHPIFPEVALVLCGIAGFESAYVFAPGYQSFQQARFESPAYAVVASAPKA